MDIIRRSIRQHLFWITLLIYCADCSIHQIPESGIIINASSSSYSPVPDHIFGAWSSKNTFGLRHNLDDSMIGLSRFLLSAIRSAGEDTRIVLAVDTVSMQYLLTKYPTLVVRGDEKKETEKDQQRLGSWLRTAKERSDWKITTVKYPIFLYDADDTNLFPVPKFAKKLQPHLNRYWIYQALVRIVFQEYQYYHYSSQYHASPFSPREPLILLTDTRDVVFQENPFVQTRERINEVFVDDTTPHSRPLPIQELATPFPTTPSSSGRNTPSVLLVAVEAEARRMKNERWNTESSLTCFSAATVASMGDLPVICSGTTMGGVVAVSTYISAMIKAIPFCVSGGMAMRFGMDQPLHIYLAHTAMLTTLVEGSGWNMHTNDDNNDDTTSYNIVLTPKQLQAYRSLYAPLQQQQQQQQQLRTQIPAHLSPTEDAYKELNSVAHTLVPHQQQQQQQQQQVGKKKTEKIQELVLSSFGDPSAPFFNNVLSNSPLLPSPSVVVFPLLHEDGPICTMANVPHPNIRRMLQVKTRVQNKSNLIIRRPAKAEAGNQGEEEDDGKIHHVIYGGFLATESSLVVLPAEHSDPQQQGQQQQSPPIPCALVHQYDRFGRSVKLFDTTILHTNPDNLYCEIDGCY